MLFKQITTFVIEMPERIDPAADSVVTPNQWRHKIAERCEHMQFNPLLPLQAQGEGFEPPFRKFNSEYVVATDGCRYLLICYRIDERKVSMPGIREKIAEKAEQVLQTEGRKMRKAEREALEDDLRAKSLPHIAPTPKRVLVLFDIHAQRVLIGSNSEALVSHIRRLLCDYILPRYAVLTDAEPEYQAPRLLVDNHCKGDAKEHYTEWFRRGVKGMHLADQAYLEKSGAKSLIVSGQSLDAPVITDALADGYQPFQVVVSVLNDDEDNVIAETVLDRYGCYTQITVPDYRKIEKSTHEDDTEAAMADLHANIVLTAGTAADVERAVKVAFGDDLAAGQAVQVSEELAAAIVEAATSPEPKLDQIYESERSEYDKAKDFVIESQKCSISAIQRLLRIGYNRAARLVEQMESDGVVTPVNGNGSRRVLITATA